MDATPTLYEFRPRFNGLPVADMLRYEDIDTVKLAKVLNGFDNLTQAGYTLVGYDGKKSMRLDAKGTLTQLKKYQESFLIKGPQKGRHPTQYIQGIDKCGRYFPEDSNGLGCLPRQIRHTIAKDTYIDIDIKNCHMVLMAWMADKYDIDARALKDYIANRDAYLAEIMEKCQLNRDGAKNIPIRVAYGSHDVPEVLKNPATRTSRLIRNLRAINYHLAELYPAYVTMARKSNRRKAEREAANLGHAVTREDYNLHCKAASRLLLDIENEVLMIMINHLKTAYGISVNVLMYDGFMLLIKDIEGIDRDALLRELETIVTNELEGLNIELTIKDMDEDIKDLDSFQPDTPTPEPTEVQPETPKDYAAMKEEFELTRFKNIKDGSYYELKPDGSLIVRSRTEMFASYEHVSYEETNAKGRTETKNFLTKWFKDTKIRQFTDVGLYPPPCRVPAGHFNTWRGFAADHIEPAATPEDIERAEADAQVLLNHIRFICNDNDELYNYVRRWYSQIFQEPGKKSEVAIMFRSAIHGMGKELLYKIIRAMIGEQYCSMIDDVERDVFGTFNPLLKNKLLVCFDEIQQGLGHKYCDKLKSAITEEHITCSDKHVKTVTLPSYIRYQFLTNNQCPLKVEEHDRRFMVLDITGQKPEKAYFNRIGDALKNPQAIRRLYDILTDKTQFDATGYDWAGNRPLTEYYHDMRAMSMEREKMFLIEVLKDHYAKKPGEKVSISLNELLNEFNHLNPEFKTNNVKFGIKIKNYKIASMANKYTKKGSVYEWNTTEAINHLKEQGLVPMEWDVEPTEFRPTQRRERPSPSSQHIEYEDE